MDFYGLLDQIVEVLRTRGRVSYRALKYQFDLDDELLETLREELVYAYRGAVREDGVGLVWGGATPAQRHPKHQLPCNGIRSMSHVNTQPNVDSSR